MPDRLDGSLREVVEILREPVHADPAFDARVMAALRAVPAPRPRTLWTRVGASRTLALRPRRWALAAAGLVAAVALGVSLHADGSAPGRDAWSELGDSEAPVAQRRVEFVLVAPTAKKVALVGDFNGWDPTYAAYRAHHRGDGVWAVTAALPVGHHRYSFVVDDSVWVADPTAPRVLDDDFGLPNSAIVVGETTP